MVLVQFVVKTLLLSNLLGSRQGQEPPQEPALRPAATPGHECQCCVQHCSASSNKQNRPLWRQEGQQGLRVSGVRQYAADVLPLQGQTGLTEHMP